MCIRDRLAIHTEKARELQGVVGVFTANDIPGDIKVGHLKQDWDALIPVGGMTHYLGDAICLVAAESMEVLEEAKSLVEVDYEVQDGVFDPFGALKEGAPKVHESGNILAHEHLIRGDAGQAIAGAKYKVTNHYAVSYTHLNWNSGSRLRIPSRWMLRPGNCQAKRCICQESLCIPYPSHWPQNYPKHLKGAFASPIPEAVSYTHLFPGNGPDRYRLLRIPAGLRNCHPASVLPLTLCTQAWS